MGHCPSLALSFQEHFLPTSERALVSGCLEHFNSRLFVLELSCLGQNILSINIYLFIYFWLGWVFVSVRGLSLVAASGGRFSSRCAGPSLSWPLLLRSTGSRRTGSVVAAHGPSCSAACGIFPYQGSNPCPLHWQADSQPLRHQGSPVNKHLNAPVKFPL